jgi:hypothetical protein
MPVTLDSFSRAPDFNVYWAVSNSTPDMLAMRPRALSRVWSTEFNCCDNLACRLALSFSACCPARRACSLSATEGQAKTGMGNDL